MELSPVIEIEKQGKIKHTEVGCQGNSEMEVGLISHGALPVMGAFTQARQPSGRESESSSPGVVDYFFGNPLAVVAAANQAAAVRSFIIYPGYAFKHNQCVCRVTHRATPLGFSTVWAQGAPFDPVP